MPGDPVPTYGKHYSGQGSATFIRAFLPVSGIQLLSWSTWSSRTGPARRPFLPRIGTAYSMSGTSSFEVSRLPEARTIAVAYVWRTARSVAATQCDAAHYEFLFPASIVEISETGIIQPPSGVLPSTQARQ